MVPDQDILRTNSTDSPFNCEMIILLFNVTNAHNCFPSLSHWIKCFALGTPALVQPWHAAVLPWRPR